MRLNEKQQKVVEENMGLVGKVIKDKVYGQGIRVPISYEELFQIGCLGLCKAAAADKGGCFSTFAYRVIWNQICDVLIQTTRRTTKEIRIVPDEDSGHISMSAVDRLDAVELQNLLLMIQKQAPLRVSLGITCLMLSVCGYTSDEIGERYGASGSTVRMWITRARRYLRERPELEGYAGAPRCV